MNTDDIKKREEKVMALKVQRDEYNKEIEKIALERRMITRKINSLETIIKRAEKDALNPKNKRGRKKKNEEQ